MAVPKTKAEGTVTYTYYTVTGKVVNGEIVVNLKGRQVSSMAPTSFWWP